MNILLNVNKDGFLFYELKSDSGLVIIDLVLVIEVFLNDFFLEK